MKKLLQAGALALAACAMAEPAMAQNQTLYVSNLGLPNLYALTVAPYLKRYLPDHPTVIVKEMPGAGGAVLCKYLAEVAPKDGSAAGIPSGVISRAMRSDPSVACVDQLALAGIWADSRVLVLGKTLGSSGNAGLKRVAEDSFGRAPVYSSGVPGGLGTVFAEAFFRSLGTPPKIVSGYGNTKNALMAVERGEADVALVRFSDLPSDPAGAGLFPVCMLGEEEGALPTCEDLARQYRPKADPKFLGVLWFVEEAVALSEPVFLPPGLPPSKAAAWETALKQASADEEFLSALRKRHLGTAFFDGQTAKSRLAAARETIRKDPDLLTRVEMLAKGS